MKWYRALAIQLLHPIVMLLNPRYVTDERHYRCYRFNGILNEIALGTGKLAAKYYKYGGGDSPMFSIQLPFVSIYWNAGKTDWSMDEFQYGFYFYDDALVFCWGKRKDGISGGDRKRDSWYFHYPWSLDFYSTEVLDYDRNTVYLEDRKIRKALRRAKIDFFAEMRIRDVIKEKHTKEYDYTYFLKNSEVQERKAKVSINRGKWAYRWFPWYPCKTVTCIDVSFNDEVGERTGSWKGGTIGCGYEMLPNETPEEALRRMEAEREF
jgi:hypothetical protein